IQKLDLPASLFEQCWQHRAGLHARYRLLRVTQRERHDSGEVLRQTRRAATGNRIDVALTDVIVVWHQTPFWDRIAGGDVVDVARIAGGRDDHENAFMAD